MKIAIHARKFAPASIFYLNQIINTIEANTAETVVTQICTLANKNTDTARLQGFKTIETEEELSKVDYFFSLGGDGTLLETVSIVGRLEIPILGINLGTLGFLATTAKIEIDVALNQFFRKEFSYDIRALIHLDNPPKGFNTQNFALNEIAILKKDISSMIVVKCFIDGEFVNKYWADGVMVATPTGSTGYSLSCGGPLIVPQSDSFIITPVNPHNLNVRPMIVSASSHISFEVEGKGRQFLISLDSRSYTLKGPTTVAVKKENFAVKLIKIQGSSFFDTLRSKLHWGQDARN